jgi:peptidyl-prolyl cis-trans isomerase D
MLAGLRKAAKSKIAAPIIVILAVSFAAWGVNDAFTGGARDAVATVGSEKVTISDFTQAFQTQVQNLSQQTGEVITTPQARQAGLDRQILSQMITGAALDAKADELRLGASDAAIARDIQATPSFQDNVRGEFSREVYTRAVGGIGLTPGEYEESLRGDIARNHVVSAVLSPARVPQTFIDARQAYQNETRTVEVLILPAVLAELDAEPDDAALQAVMDENAAAFTFPGMRALTVAWLDMATMQAIVEVSDEDVRALYDFRRDSLSTPATRDYAQISAPDEATANAVAERLRAGEAPEAIATDLGLSAPILGDAAAQGDIVDETIAAQIFESAEPRVFTVEGQLGWAAVQVTGGADATEPTFEESEATLRAELAEEGAQDRLYEAIAQIEDARGAGRSLEDAAAEAGVAPQSYEPVTAQGQDAAGNFYVDLAQAPELLGAAFALNPSETSEMIELPDGGYAMVYVDEVIPERVAALDEMRDEAEAMWRAQQIDAALQALETQAREQIEGGASFADAAAAIGQPARTEIAIVRRGQTAGPVDAQLSAAVFAASEGELVSGRTAGDSRALARVTRIEHPAQPDPALANAMVDEVSNDLLTQFQAALADEYPVRIYEDQIGLALGDAPQTTP